LISLALFLFGFSVAIALGVLEDARRKMK